MEYDYLADALECGHDESEFDGLAWVAEPRDPYYSRFDHLHPEE
jgi:hypothetical protein